MPVIRNAAEPALQVYIKHKKSIVKDATEKVGIFVVPEIPPECVWKEGLVSGRMVMRK